MIVTIQLRPLTQPRRQAVAPMRRLFVYPHRSVRGIGITFGRYIFALLTAIVLTAAVVALSDSLLVQHNRLGVMLLNVSGIPVTGTHPVDLFANFDAAPVPVVAVDRIEASPLKHWILFSLAMLILLGIHRRISFTRSFLTCLMTLLMLTAGVLIFHPESQLDSATFAQMWLRGESLVWLVLPWFSAGMFILTQSAVGLGIVWAVLVQAYGFVWSAIRLSFCIAVMCFSGTLFVPMFWFVFGFLADAIYVVVFYSVAVHCSSRRKWGKRAV